KGVGLGLVDDLAWDRQPGEPTVDRASHHDGVAERHVVDALVDSERAVVVIPLTVHHTRVRAGRWHGLIEVIPLVRRTEIFRGGQVQAAYVEQVGVATAGQVDIATAGADTRLDVVAWPRAGNRRRPVWLAEVR